MFVCVDHAPAPGVAYENDAKHTCSIQSVPSLVDDCALHRQCDEGHRLRSNDRQPVLAIKYDAAWRGLTGAVGHGA